MTRRLKYAAIWFLDWIVDVRILRHRFPGYCAWLVDHPWWGPGSEWRDDGQGFGGRGR